MWATQLSWIDHFCSHSGYWIPDKKKIKKKPKRTTLQRQGLIHPQNQKPISFPWLYDSNETGSFLTTVSS